MKAGEVLKVLHISRQTLTKYVHEGIVKAELLPNGRFNYDEDSVYAFLNKDVKRKTYIYARVSTQRQKEDLEEQVEALRQFCFSKGYVVSGVFEEVASGLSFDKRREFFKMMDDIMDGKVQRVVVADKSRLSRTSFELLRNVFGKYQCDILPVSETESNVLDSEELADDVENLLQSYPDELVDAERVDRVMDALLWEDPGFDVE